MIKYVPLIGPYLLRIARGGEFVTGVTLGRFFAVHTIILPWFMFYFMLLHFLMIRKQGIAKPL